MATGGASATDGGLSDGGGGRVGSFVDCVNGSDDVDGGTGLESAPFKTIGHALATATAERTVWLLDGVCDDTTEPAFAAINQPIDVPDGVSIRAINPGQVTFRGSAGGLRAAALRFAGSGEVIGIRFERFGRGITASAGTLRLVGVSFDDVYQGRPLELSGTVEATLEPGGVTNYVGTNQRGFASLTESARLEVNGGTISGTVDSGISGDTVFVARDQAELVLDAFTLSGSSLSGIHVRDDAKVTVRNGSLLSDIGSSACCNQSVAHFGGNATFELIDSRIEDAKAAGLLCSLAGGPVVHLTNATITNGTGGAIVSPVYSDCRPELTIQSSRLTGNRSGIDLNYGGDLTVSDSFIEDNGSTATGCGHGIYLNDDSVAQSLTLKNTSVQRNCAYGVRLHGAASSTFDLGRGNAPGGNTLAGNHVPGNPFSNLTVSATQALTVYASGNTWEPGVQGAAPAGSTDPLPGRYAVLSGNVNDVTGTTSGANIAISGSAAASTIVRVAEAACVPAGNCP